MIRSTTAEVSLAVDPLDSGPSSPGHRGGVVDPLLISGDGPVVALRRHAVVAPGGLADRVLVDDGPYVTAYELDGSPRWVSAESVWMDVDLGNAPQNPRATGVATGSSRERALLGGLSDRIGWEAMLSFEQSPELSLVDTSALEMSIRKDGIAVLDGCLGLDIPTVVVVGDDVLRWGAGSTWDAAIQRALYGDAGTMDPAIELAQLVSSLERHGLTIATVDLGTPILHRAGVHRLSVQLLSR